MSRSSALAVWAAVSIAVATESACDATLSRRPPAGASGPPAPVVFAVIGDYGADNAGEAAVAALVRSWRPEFVLTTGDNNYDGPGAIDRDVGKYYGSFIAPYAGAYGAGSTHNRFWPSPGNHDWDVDGLADYRAYFALPGNERYYDADLGLVHLFAIDSDPREPDGTGERSAQARWLRGALAASTACHNVVFFHHPPYTAGTENGPEPAMRWPFKEWAASIVLSGHEHVYERFDVDGLPYVVNGLGGDDPYELGPAPPQSRARFTGVHGAVRAEATRAAATFAFFAVDGRKVDEVTTRASPRCR